jgi:hypothetical protein
MDPIDRLILLINELNTAQLAGTDLCRLTKRVPSSIQHSLAKSVLSRLSAIEDHARLLAEELQAHSHG